MAFHQDTLLFPDETVDLRHQDKVVAEAAAKLDNFRNIQTGQAKQEQVRLLKIMKIIKHFVRKHYFYDLFFNN